MNKWLEILVGLLIVLVAVYAWTIDFWGMGVAALNFLKGGIVWLVILIGAVMLLLGISDLKD